MNEIVVSAPGKIILHGEHSVVYGRSAIACSLNTRTYLKLIKTDNNTVSIDLPDIGVKLSWTLEEIQGINLAHECDILQPKPPTEEVLSALKQFLIKTKNTNVHNNNTALIGFLYMYLSICKNREHQSIGVKVNSELPVSAGLGSSAGISVCVSTVMLLLTETIDPPIEYTWKSNDLDLINRWAYIGETLNHGKPSGIDNSIATFGRAIKFKSGNIVKLDRMPSLRILLIDTKIPRSTKDLVTGVRKTYEQYEDIVKPVLDSMEAIVTKSEDILYRMTNNDTNITSCYKILQDLVDMNQSLLTFLGVSHPSLDSVCRICSEYGLHCKLTGAGGGGCAYCYIPPETSPEGLHSLQTELKDKNYECWDTYVGGNGVMCHTKSDTME